MQSLRSPLLVGILFTLLLNHHMLWGMKISNKLPPSDEFWEAVKSDKTTIVKRLYNQFDLNVEDQDGKTPLMWATHNGNVELVQLFLKSGANVNFRSKSDFTALMNVVPWGVRECNIPLAELLLTHHADPNVVAFNGFTAMRMAVGSDSRLVPLLIKAGADSFSKDDAMYLAIGDGKLETLALLADNTDYSSKTLSYAKNYGKKDDKKVLALAAQKNVARKVLQEAQRLGIGAVDVRRIIKRQFGGR